MNLRNEILLAHLILLTFAIMLIVSVFVSCPWDAALYAGTGLIISYTWTKDVNRRVRAAIAEWKKQTGRT